MNNSPASRQRTGPPVYENWLALIRGAPPSQAYEVPLFTDAVIVGMITDGFGPYQLINTIAHAAHPCSPIVPPAIVLRIQEHRAGLDDEVLTSNSKKNDELYHGGMLPDEVAALVSLALGIRLIAGAVTRVFEPESDPRGRPIAYYHADLPQLPSAGRNLVIPRAIGRHSLDEVAPVTSLPRIARDDAIALVRSARLYQQAMWIAEADPAASWLLFVSALETAANQWRAGMESPVERMRANKPDLEKVLLEAGGDELVNRVAVLIADSMGSTKKFVDFALAFAPDAPHERPEPVFQFTWEPQSMRKTLKLIYNYRSEALHDGKPFPAPMCEVPNVFETSAVPAEIPIGHTIRTHGGTWRRQDVPVLLHTFEFIARGTLLRWWSALAQTT